MQSITLQNVADTDIVNNDILGQICFAAPNEAGGTDSILIAASMFARSEGTFAADNNATELVFVTGATESAAPGATNYDMTLSSAGNLTVVGDLTISGDDLTMATNTSGAALIADGTNFNPVVISGDIAIGTDGTATIQANSVDGTMIALGSDTTGDIMYYNGTNYARLAASTDGHVLTATGAGAAPAWEAAGGASDLNDLGDVSYGGTNLTRSLLINASPEGAPETGTLGSDCSYNLAIGYQALNSITDSQYNVALGRSALTALTTGDGCVAIGYEAGAANTAGHAIFLGYLAGRYNTTGTYPVYIGHKAGYQSSTGNSNVAVGYSALHGAWSSDNHGNTAIGAFSLKGITTGNYNVSLGYSAGYSITTGGSNINLGKGAGYDNTTLSNLLFIGNDNEGSDGTLIKGDMDNKYLAIGMADDSFSNSSGSATLQIYPKTSTDKAIHVKQISSQSGDLLLMEDSSGTDLFLISSAGVVTTGTWQGTAIATAYIADNAITGAKIALGSDTTGDIMYYNGTNYVRLAAAQDGYILTATGAGAAPAWEAAAGGGGTSDIDDLGDVSYGGTNLTYTLLLNNAPGSAPTTGTLGSDCSYNLAIGYTALNSITGATHNIALGRNCLTACMTGDWNVAIGRQALESTTTGGANVAIGYYAGREGLTAHSNVWIGPSAGYYGTGSHNIAIGQSAMKGAIGVTSGNIYNIALGYYSLNDITTGEKNIAIGHKAGENLTTDSSMLYIANDGESGGTLIKGDMANKYLAIGMADDSFSNSSGSATLQIYSKTTTDKAIYVKQIASQSGDLLLMEDSIGTDLFLINSAGVVTFSKAIKPALEANSDGSTVTFDLNEANVHTVTLGVGLGDGTRTFAISNETAGQKFIIRILQDGTGSRTVTWFSTIKWAGGSAPTLTTTANKADVVGFIVTGTDTYDGFVVGQNI